MGFVVFYFLLSTSNEADAEFYFLLLIFRLDYPARESPLSFEDVANCFYVSAFSLLLKSLGWMD